MQDFSRPFDDYYVARRSKLRGDFDNFGKYGRRILVSQYGDDLADTIFEETNTQRHTECTEPN